MELKSSSSLSAFGGQFAVVMDKLNLGNVVECNPIFMSSESSSISYISLKLWGFVQIMHIFNILKETKQLMYTSTDVLRGIWHGPQNGTNGSIYLHYICLHFHQRKISTSSKMANKLIESFGRTVSFLPCKVFLKNPTTTTSCN